MPSFPSTGLISYWKLDEASGTRADSVGTRHLTDNNTVLSAPGKIGTAADFEADTTESLEYADPAPLGDQDFTYTLWFKCETFGVTNMKILAKDFGGTNRRYSFTLFSTGNLFFIYYPDGTTQVVINAAGFNNTNWHFAVLWHDAAANTISLQVDGGTPASSSPYAVAYATLGMNPSFRLGSQSTGGEHFDGLIDEVGFWGRVLTAQERADLYNGGAGLAYAPPPPSFPGTGLRSYWTLDEVSGTRVDSVGTNHLTPTNAPVGAAGKIGNGADFERDNSQYLSHADPTPLGDQDFTYAFWCRQETFAPFAGFLSKDGSYTLRDNGGGGIAFLIGGGSTGTLNGPTIPTPTNWHFVIAWHDATANTINVQLDNGTVSSAPTTGPMAANAAPVQIGLSLGTYYDGQIDEVGCWGRVLTAQERTDLYNGGAGLAFSTTHPEDVLLTNDNRTVFVPAVVMVEGTLPFRIRVDLQYYEHVATDPTDLWIYAPTR